MAQQYSIHNNCAISFIIGIANGIVTIIDNKTNNIITTISPHEIFVGKSPRTAQTEFSGGFGDEFDGNTILLKIDNKKYMYIGGEHIKTFDTDYDIINYVSPMGNNYVSYPYAIDTNNNYYLIEEDVIIKNIRPSFNHDPYSIYYKKNLMSPKLGMVNPIMPTITNFMNITKFYVSNDGNVNDDHKYALRYEPYPNETYNRLTDNGTKRLYIKFGDIARIVSIDEFKDIMEQFGRLANFEPIKNINICY